ncbi:hypothetical protein KIN20_010606 [Parelaphostrongylus tenuis]|uniref:Uncharacterized protein n=1 Tax=Parelaphostrongylus tenuis TaxID=148309 RepID=A0AAD5QLX7_PARTN|nr:hypothetical protein KIN20_010606 [Parelaphostrongylus tenuis]
MTDELTLRPMDDPLPSTVIAKRPWYVGECSGRMGIHLDTTIAPSLGSPSKWNVPAESPPIPSSPQLTCLNQTAMFALCGAFVITALFSTVFITYLFRDVCRSITRPYLYSVVSPCHKHVFVEK